MQSLYKVIKKSSVVRQGEEKIKTNYKKPVSLEKEIEKEKEIEEENSKKFIDSYENLARNILENARKKSEEFLSKAYAEAEVVEEEAFKKGHEEGFHKGSEEGKKSGYEEAYEAYIEKGKNAYEEMVQKSNKLLLDTEAQYNSYLKEKEEEVRNLVLTIVEEVLKHEVKDKSSMNEIIYEKLEESKKSATFIVKSNTNYYEEIKAKSEFWKNQLPYRGEIFVIEDISLKDGEVIIETEQGKVIASLDTALDKIKELLINEK
ncbi:flagellar assembly protein FliH [Clostridium botulinum]|uniref:Flagellar assembly protein FliH n=1 Tax=Clostridium combesii TaxID=39481 RepID=A0A2G7HF38_9CLOT|nr:MULTISPECIES: FliH/SctL family protein [Clostridium]APQ77389.1 flagellar assembly FliH family protein [Clostridium botulinum]AUM99924.1 flagellar assembly protein FliH [Clostridium botulinum]AUN18543.1 flagellar assembly protein FliH [Clostridium botulinum]KEI87950.1 flagellar assembly protein FliH [Clostridium botulinum B2 267]MBN3354706.1 flagellar assembly protein FliH [Clostridium botulinum]